MSIPVKMDGTEVLINALVHDVARGEGMVTETDTDKIVVRFGRQQHAYNSNGVGSFGRRTLFWADPIVVSPPSNRTYWVFMSAVLRQCVNGMAELVDKAVRNA